MRQDTSRHRPPRPRIHVRVRAQARGRISARSSCATLDGDGGPAPPPRLALLGPFELTCQSRRAARLPKKAQALLAYLATRPERRASREHLAALFWGEHGTEQARRSLRQCLMTVRDSLAGDLVVAEGAQIALATHIHIDVTEFEKLAQSVQLAELEEAGRLYRDEFLCGLRIPSEPFQEWLTVERQRLAARMSEVLSRLAALRAAAGEVERGVEAAERLIRFDPLREDGHRLLVRLLFAAGRRSAALTQYERCVDILRRDLGVAPEPETVQLADHIRSGRPMTTIEAVPARTAHSIGRDAFGGSRGGGDGGESCIDSAQKASILVLGFSNLSGDPDQDYFAHGIAQDITIALGRVPWLLVIAGCSVASGRQHASIQEIDHGLNVRYVLRGSVRRSGSRIRIVVQMLESASRRQIWCDRFEGDVDNIFDIQDRVAMQAAAVIAPKLHLLEVERAQRKPTNSLGAYDLYLRAVPRFRKSAADNQEALHLLRQAIALDPSYGAAYALAARCYHFQKILGWVHPADSRLQEGVRLARLAEEFGGEDSEALWMAGLALVFLAGELDHGGRLIEKSLSFNPSSANAWIASCFARTFLGDGEAAMEHFTHAQRLNPLDITQHVRWNAAGNIHFIAGRYYEALEVSAKTLSEIPTYPPGLRMKITSCGLLGRLDEAREAVQLLLQVNPDTSVATLGIFWEPLLRRNPGVLDRYLQGLRIAGLRAQ